MNKISNETTLSRIRISRISPFSCEYNSLVGALKYWCKTNSNRYFLINGSDATPVKSHKELVYRVGGGLGVI